MKEYPCHRVDGISGEEFYYCGPRLEEGKLPAIFYFALSGQDSLCLDPFNQPVMALREARVRVFSLSLPHHGPGLDNATGVGRWVADLRGGVDVLTPFIERVVTQIDALISQGIVDPSHLGVAGLSRGAFIACHVAAREKRIRAILGYAPLTRLSFFRETATPEDEAALSALDVQHLGERLYDRRIRFYIGNKDTRVGTRECFNVVDAFVETAHHHKVRSAQVEMVIFPSIGYKGHGTPPHIFDAGAEWIKQAIS